MIAAALVMLTLTAEPAALSPGVLTLEVGDVVTRQGQMVHAIDVPRLAVTEAVFEKYTAQQMEKEKLQVAKDALAVELKDCLVRCEGCKAPSPTSSSFNSTSFFVGAVVGTLVGVAVTTAAAYGVYTLSRDLSK